MKGRNDSKYEGKIRRKTSEVVQSVGVVKERRSVPTGDNFTKFIIAPLPRLVLVCT